MPLKSFGEFREHINSSDTLERLVKRHKKSMIQLIKMALNSSEFDHAFKEDIRNLAHALDSGEDTVRKGDSLDNVVTPSLADRAMGGDSGGGGGGE